MDVRTEHEPVGVHQDVQLPSGQPLRPVVAAFGTARPSGLDNLAVDHAHARVPVAPLRPRTASPSRLCTRLSRPARRHLRKW